MADFTSRLQLRKPTDGENVNVETDLGENFDKIDQDMGARIVTSTTRPAIPYQGLIIYETDTKDVLIYNGDKWQYLMPKTIRGYGGGGGQITGTYTEPTLGAEVVLTPGFWKIEYVQNIEISTSTNPRVFECAVGVRTVGNIDSTLYTHGASANWPSTSDAYKPQIHGMCGYTVEVGKTATIYLRTRANAVGGAQINAVGRIFATREAEI